MESFQKRFLEAKERSGLRWIDIADRSGLNKAKISQYKNGIHVPEPETMYILASVLNVSMEWLTGAEVTNLVAGEEMDFIWRYRSLNDRGKVEISRFLDSLLSLKMYKR